MRSYSGGYEQVNLSTAIDLGSFKSRMALIAPYPALRITYWLIADASVGYGSAGEDLTRLDPTTALQASAQTRANTWFGHGNLTASIPVSIPKLSLDGILGYVFGSRKTAGYMDSIGTLIPDDRIWTSQARAGPRVSYLINVPDGTLEPYVSALAQYASL